MSDPSKIASLYKRNTFLYDEKVGSYITMPVYYKAGYSAIQNKNLGQGPIVVLVTVKARKQHKK